MQHVPRQFQCSVTDVHDMPCPIVLLSLLLAARCVAQAEAAARAMIDGYSDEMDALRARNAQLAQVSEFVALTLYHPHQQEWSSRSRDGGGSKQQQRRHHHHHHLDEECT